MMRLTPLIKRGKEIRAPSLSAVVRAAGKQSRTKVCCRVCVPCSCQRNGARICLLELKSKAEAYQLGRKQEPVTRTENTVTVDLSTMLAY